MRARSGGRDGAGVYHRPSGVTTEVISTRPAAFCHTPAMRAALETGA